MAYAAIVSLSQLLGHVLHHHLHQYSHVPQSDERKKLESLHEKLSFLQAFLDDHHLHEAGEMIRSLEAKIRETAHQAQDIIEQHIFDQIRTGYENGGMKKGCCQSVLSTVRKKKQLRTLNKNYKAGLLEALDQINLIVEEATNFKMMMQSVEASQISTTQTPALASSSQAGNSKKKMVGYEEDLIAIQERLCGESSKLNVIPIVGMGGIGKTTFAKYIFDDSLIAYHFHTRAWATISQQYHLPGILLGILHSFTLETDRSTHANMTNEQLMERIYKKLKGMRYLIVLDDMWTTEAWDDLRMFLPDDNNGSRIVITTRLGNVAEYVSSSPIHHMHLINEEESWNMLQEKVFVEESCPPELEEIGKMIAKNCGGLPLAILVVAGILTTVAMTELYWKNLAENVSVVVATVDGNFSKLLRLSYDHLPNHLKPCFLYVGGFAVYYEIPVSDLIKLWVAEGFLKPIESKTLEEAAEEYLEDLVKRNLVFMSKKTWTGRFKCCSVHDLLRDLCIQIAQEENFLAVADMYGDIHGTDFANSRRLSISSPVEIKVSNPSELLIRSVLQFSFACRVSSLISCSRLLRVLAMPNTWLRSFPDETTEMFHLRYLAFAYINFSPVPFMLPPAILKLENLQTLIINRSSDIRSKLPVPLDIWKMPQLRHIILKGCLLLIPSPPRIGGSIHVLENLQTVSRVANFKFSREAIAMIPNVKKLKLVHSSRELSELGLTSLVHFHQLETLNLHLLGTGIVKTSDYFTDTIPDPIPMYYALPTSIRRLSLTGCRPPLEDMSIIGSLPNLEVLKLKIFDFVDRCWETKEGEFVRLKFLQINWSNLMSWRTESSHLPRLEHLIVKCCWNLEEIPSEFRDIATLKVIDIEACSQFVAQSALAIQEDQENMGNELLVKVLNEF